MCVNGVPQPKDADSRAQRRRGRSLQSLPARSEPAEEMLLELARPRRALSGDFSSSRIHHGVTADPHRHRGYGDFSTRPNFCSQQHLRTFNGVTRDPSRSQAKEKLLAADLPPLRRLRFSPRTLLKFSFFFTEGGDAPSFLPVLAALRFVISLCNCIQLARLS